MTSSGSDASLAKVSFHNDSFEAIGVVNQVTVTDPAVLEAAGAITRAKIAELDAACSRFREDGEILALNRAGPAGMEVSPILFAATAASLAAAAASDGLVDPTIGAALRSLGYDRDFELIGRRSPTGAFELIPATGWRSVRMDPERRRITLAEGTQLDLGATAKALAADWIAQEIHEATGGEVLVGLGGDISVMGSPPLVDPATGASATEYWRTVSVAAASCLDANVATTAAIALGARAVPWLERQGLAARLVHRDGRVEVIGGWPGPDRGSQRVHRVA